MDIELHNHPRDARLMQIVAEASRAYRIHRNKLTSSTLLGLYQALSNMRKNPDHVDYLILAVLDDNDQITDAIILETIPKGLKEIKKRAALITAFQTKPSITPDMIDAVLRHVKVAQIESVGAFLLNHAGKRAVVGYL